MIVLWVNRREWRLPGPIINMTVHNAWSFAANGLESRLCLAAGADSSTDEDLRQFYDLPPLPGFHIKRYKHTTLLPGMGGKMGVYSQTAMLARKLAQRDKVAVFTRDSSFLPWMRLLQGDPRIRCFYELHDLYSDLTWRQEPDLVKYQREKWLERLFLPGMAGLVCITEDQGEIYRHLYPRTPVISRPLGTKPAPPPDMERKRLARTVFYVGHMHGPKGVKFLTESAAGLARQGVRMEFWGGYEKDTARINGIAAEKGVQEWMRAEPFQPPAKLHEAMAARASLGVVMLADTYYNRHLTCPVKALDYLSHGIPALGTPLPSVRGVLGDAGIYIAQDDAATFTSEVVRLLDSPAAYAEASLRAQTRANEITWQARARSLADFASDNSARWS